MTEVFWIWVDLNGLGMKWELAVNRDDEVYFPWLDFSDHPDNFKSHQKLRIQTPPDLVSIEEWNTKEDHPCDNYNVNKCSCAGACSCHFRDTKT